MTLPTRFGSEFLVSANPGTQTLSSVARLDNGQMVVVWTEGVGAGADIKFRLLNADGTPAGDIQTANVTTNGSQTNAKVAAQAGGKFAIVWEDYSTDASGNAAYRVFNADGSSSMLAEKTVYDGSTQSNTSLQWPVQIAGRADGTFLIGWSDNNTANSGLSSSSAAMVRAFDANGDGVGNAIRISGNFGGDWEPVIATSGNEVTLVWDDDGGPTPSQNAEDGIYFRTITGALPTTNFTDGGTRANTGEFRESARWPDAAYTNLGLVTVWEDTRTNITVGADIYARLANGAVVQVNATVGGDQLKPEIAGLVGSGFVVVWSHINGTGGSDVRARYFDSTGTALDLDFLVTQTSFSGSSELDVDVAGLLDGRFVVTWGTESSASRGTEGMIFDPRTAAVTWFGTDDEGSPTGRAEQYWGTNLPSAGDFLYGGFGDDKVYGQAGADTIYGGPGSDSVEGGDGDDALFGDTVVNDSDLVYSGNDTVSGGNGDDTLIGGYGVNLMDGGSGTDSVDYNLEYTIALEPGFLSYQVTSQISLAAGHATVRMTGTNVFGDPFDFDVVTDTLMNIENATGTNGGDAIVGSSLANVLSGNAGNDRLNGGAGDDSLNGGAGIDTAIYNNPASAYTITRNGVTTTVSGPDGIDTVRGVEKLQFTGGTIRDLTSLGIDPSGDLKSDILWRNSNGEVALWLMNGLTPTTQTAFGSVPVSMSIVDGNGDFNGDGKSDILWRNSNGDVTLWLMDGVTPTAQAAVGSAPSNWTIAGGHGDYNGDGMDDILWRSSAGDAAMWLMNGTTSIQQAVFGTVPTSWSVVNGSGDYNGDGKGDILWRNSTGDVALWLMNGVTAIGQAVFGSVPTTWGIVDGHGDYNSDGNSDILWRNGNGDVALWLMNGLTPIGQAVFGSVPTTWSIVEGHGDYNGDGNSDVLWRNSTGDVALWLMNGVTPIGQAVFGSVPNTWTIVDGHSDYNGDGMSDLLWRNSNGDVAQWLMSGLTPIGQAVFASVPTTWSITTELGGLLSGDGAADTLTGTTARDTLIGNDGADTLAGGTGADTFVYNATSDSTPALSDLITDFEHGIDRIDLSAIDANTITPADQAFLFGGNNVNTVPNSVTWSEGGGNTTLRIDNTGDTMADMQVVLTGIGLGLTAADFVL